MPRSEPESAKIAAARSIVAVHAGYVARNTNLAQAALAGAREYVEWTHYPRKDLVDSGNETEFYYHAHAAEERALGEHGHFHIFARPASGGFTHLVGISLDDRGRAMRLFTTNRWVTGETWRRAALMEPVLRRFAVRAAGGRLAPVARWIEAMVCFYDDQILALIHERDKLIPNGITRGDRSMHIVTQVAIDPLRDIERLASQAPTPDHIL